MNVRTLVVSTTLLTAWMSLGDEKAVIVRPLTAVVVTQCNLLVVAYITMPDGSLVRYTRSSRIPYGKVLELAKSAQHSEVADIPCDAPKMTT